MSSQNASALRSPDDASASTSIPGANLGASRPVTVPHLIVPREPTPARPAPTPPASAVLERGASPLASPAFWGTSLLFALLLTLAGMGMPYFTLSMAERVRSPLHIWFRPSGYIGQSLGIAAFLFFMFLWLYPMRKRYRRLAFTGPIGKWLSVHIVAGLGIPLLVGIHAGWRFRGLAGLSYTAMMIVVASGVIGKYIYSRIPRSKGGLELSLEEIRSRSEIVTREIQATTGLDAAGLRQALGLAAPQMDRPGLLATLGRMIRDDLHRAGTLRRLRREWGGAEARGRRLDPARLEEALRLARQQIATEQQVRLLEATQAIFRFWHAAHRPVAVTALIAVVIHVVVVIAIGATWFH